MSKRVLFFALIAVFILAPLAMSASYEQMKDAYQKKLDGVQLSMAEKSLAKQFKDQYITPFNVSNELDEVGGPDGYGYLFIDSQEEEGPEFTWVDITETGNEVTGWQDDIRYGPFEIGFDFPFYGETCTEFFVCSNGWISFTEQPNNEYTNTALPNAEAPNNVIYWFWNDLYPTASDTMYYEEVEEGHTVIQFGNDGYIWDELLYIQIHLYDTGEIIVSYDETCVHALNLETLGLENSDGTVALQASFDDNPLDYPVYGTSILYYLAEADANLSGTVTNSTNGAPLEGVVVTAAGGTATTDASGNYTINDCYSATCWLSAEPEGEFLPHREIITLNTGNNTVDISIDPWPEWAYRDWREEDFMWIERSVNATDLDLSDDDTETLTFSDYGLGSFEWYGVEYQSMYVISNGWFSFLDPINSIYQNPPVCPATTTPNGTIAPFALDLNPTIENAAVWAENVDGQLVITYEEVPYYGQYTDVNTFQVVMDFETLDVWFNFDSTYANTDDNDTLSIGYEDNEGLIGHQIFRSNTHDWTPINEVTYHLYIPSETAIVSGTIVDSDNNPLQGVGVALAPEEGDIMTAFTDEFGAYELTELSPGTYDMIATLDGYTPYVQEDIVLAAMDDVEINITLSLIGTFSIEDIQTTVEVGTWVTTTGIVTLPTNSIHTDRFDCYIQDESGYGVMLYDSEAIDPGNNLNRGDEIQVTGQVAEFNGMTELVDFEYEVQSTGNDLPDPYTGTTGDMANQQGLEGAWAEIMGALQSDPETGSYPLSVDDGSGAVNVYINEAAGLDLTGFGQGDWIVFRGPIGLYQNAVQLVPSLAEDFNAPVLKTATGMAATRPNGNPLVTLDWEYGDETDEFIEFIIFRNGNALTEVDTIGFIDDLDGQESGEYEYWVVVSYDEGMSANSDTAVVNWDGISVADNFFAQIPTEYSIARAYPNPFNPTMTAVIGLPDASNLDVRVFNILGKQVSVLAQGRFAQGYHTFTFDASDLSSGIYFIQAHVPGKMNSVRKVSLIR